ncbi:MAG: C69 family dipeptidase [Bacteroidales bacterium]|nr:C69 family dipeptidase [Bacteroidales bacterium]MCF8403621.1 C69 family dipeptidase [Bacteroidales bacterium]
MRARFGISCLFLISVLVVFSQKTSDFTHDCFSVLVGKDASADGSVMFAHNEDDWGDRIVNWYQVPARNYNAGETITLKNGAIMEQVNATFNYLWLEMPEMDFSDSYMNEWGVTISSDACLSREKKPELTDGGIGYWLRRAMAERAKTAREAVQIGGALVEQFGYASSGRTYCIADAHEAWMLSVVYGKHWVAQRIPDDHIAIIPNYYTITTIDLSDSENYYGSADLVDYAIKKKWYDPEEDGEFNFRLVYSDEGNLENMGNIVRHWSAINTLFTDQYQVEEEFPFSYKPKKKIELSDLFTVLRNHNEGSEYDQSENYIKGNPHEHGRAICSNTTQYGFVAQLRSDLPKEIAFVLWLSPFRPCVHAFTQWYFGMAVIPDGFAVSNYQKALSTHFDPIENVFEFAPKNRFLKFVKDAREVDKNYGSRIATIQSKISTLENELIKNQKSFEEKILKLASRDERMMQKSLTDYCIKQIEQAEEIIDE